MSERVSVTYTGEDAVEVFAGANPNPSIVQPGESVEVDGWAATVLLTSGGPWRTAGAAPEGILKGKALDDALKVHELPTTGTASEKRARLAEHEAALEAQAAQLEQNPDTEVDQPSATDDDTTETDA